MIARMAHAHLRHPGGFDDCPSCYMKWAPSRDFGVLVSDGPRLVERSATVARLLVP